MTAPDAAFPAPQPPAGPSRLSPRATSSELSPGWHCGCPWHPAEPPDGDSSRGAVRRHQPELGKTFHLWEAAGPALSPPSCSWVCLVCAASGGWSQLLAAPRDPPGLGELRALPPCSSHRAWGHCSDSHVLVCLTGELCPQLWDEDLAGDKYENVTGKERPSQRSPDTPGWALCPARGLPPVPGPGSHVPRSALQVLT